jgi:hypothetical protein
MGLLNLLTGGASRLGWGGGQVPSNKMSRVLPNPPGTRHDEYSINGNPNIRMVGAGFVPPKPAPSSLEEGDTLNTAKFRNKTGKKYTDNLPR